MKKAFLSHSSFDKDFVEEVYKLLGAGKAIYDKESFQKNCDIPYQIRHGLEECKIYVLFLSSSSLESGWVAEEIDITIELKSKHKVDSILIFQLDDTKWDKLPSWMGRYITSCPPSPRQVALRILDELNHEQQTNQIHGRSDEVRDIIEGISESNDEISYLFLSGPDGIGRRTLAQSVFDTYYHGISRHKLEISISDYDGLIDIYRNTLSYSANWRARDLIEETEKFASMSEVEQYKLLSELIKTITTTFNQILIINVNKSTVNERGTPQTWFSKLTASLTPSHYPYVLFISNRFLDGRDLTNGFFFSVHPLNEKWSSLLFTILIKKYDIDIPSQDEQSIIKKSVVGHAGLIHLVVNYLRKNPNYKPNKTHNSIVSMLREHTSKILSDFSKDNIELEKAIALFSEVSVISYDEIIEINNCWPSFVSSVEALIDAGLLQRIGADYSLVSYLQRAAELYSHKHHESLKDAIKTLLNTYQSIDGDSFIPIQLINERIVEHLNSGEEIDGYLTCLIQPSQQLKAAKRRYDDKDYKNSLKLSKSAYEQKNKLSDSGTREAWRLIGLSSVRDGNEIDFNFFCNEYNKLKKNFHTDAIYYFCNGFRQRTKGYFGKALEWFEKIDMEKYKDSHACRELSYIFAFDRDYEKATHFIKIARELAFDNPYILDTQAMILLNRFKKEKARNLINDIDECLDMLRESDERNGTFFYRTRSRIRDVIVDGKNSTLESMYKDRQGLPIAARLALLDLLSIKGKNLQYDELHHEISDELRKKKNNIALVELVRTNIEHLCYTDQAKIAKGELQKYRDRFTSVTLSQLDRLVV